MGIELANRDEPKAHRRAPRVLWWALALVAVVGIGIAAGALWLHGKLVSVVRDELLPKWSKDYDSTVTLDRLSIWVLPSVRITGEGLTFRIHGHEAEPPLLHARQVTATAGILGIFQKPYKLHLLDVRGLELNVPPSRPSPPRKPETERSKFYFDEIRADGGILRKLPAQPNKKAAEFQFPRVRLHTSGVHDDVRFDTEVRIPKPPGLVHAT